MKKTDKVVCLSMGVMVGCAKKHIHEYSAWASDDEITHSRTCECGDVQKENHEWDNGVITTEATCAAEGVKTFTCSVCGQTKTQVIAKSTIHTYGDLTSDKESNTHSKTCSVCGDKQTEAHKFTKATALDSTTHTSICSECSGEFTQEHNFVDGICSDCGCDNEGKLELKLVTDEHGTVKGAGRQGYNSQVTITATPNAGYSFDGWYDGDEKKSDEASYQFNMPASAVTYTAKWKANEYTITLNADNGDESTTQTVTYDSAYEIPVPQKTGYTFVGWYDGDTELTGADGKSKLNCDFTTEKMVTAKWQAKTCTITLNANGGTLGVTTSLSVTYDGQYTELPKLGDIDAPTKADHVLNGWTKTQDGTDDITLADMVNVANGVVIASDGSASQTLYAKWMSVIDYMNATYDYTDNGDGTYIITKAKDKTLSYYLVPEGVTKLLPVGANGAFNDCTNAVKIDLPSTLTEIGNYTFHQCCSLTSIAIPNSVTRIGDSAFHYCGALTSVIIPDGITTIGVWTFRSCDSLTTVTIPKSVTRIEIQAFNWCDNLSTINYAGTIDEWSQVTIVTEMGGDEVQNIKSGCVVKCTDGDITIQ